MDAVSTSAASLPGRRADTPRVTIAAPLPPPSSSSSGTSSSSSSSFSTPGARVSPSLGGLPSQQKTDTHGVQLSLPPSVPQHQHSFGDIHLERSPPLPHVEHTLNASGPSPLLSSLISHLCLSPLLFSLPLSLSCASMPSLTLTGSLLLYSVSRLAPLCIVLYLSASACRGQFSCLCSFVCGWYPGSQPLPPLSSSETIVRARKPRLTSDESTSSRSLTPHSQSQSQYPSHSHSQKSSRRQADATDASPITNG